ncbi:response regulator [Herminiimonas arsenitoxidans]|uniref:response regulator n=1 Tax=Herminiimonas arsenitoxidans TaxID=1809410 RepID=UPI00097092D0|nr:response regulator transcription factor [Herminiimonas arsenitoxidans]
MPESTILLIDDHTMFREGMVLALAQVAPHLQILAASNGMEAITALETHAEISAVVMDYYLPDIGGSALLHSLRQARPGMRILVLSASEDSDDVHHALAAGANGFIHKSADSHTLLEALSTVMSGGRYVPTAYGLSTPPAEQSDDATLLSNLTPRQREALLLVCEGCPNSDIATRLGTTEKTIKAHLSAIFATLNVRNRTQAALIARRGGLLGKPK